MERTVEQQGLRRPDLETIRQAHERIKPHIHRTPVLTSTAVNEICGGSLHFKCENFQKAGSFKARGACNAVLSLDEETAARGVVTHSSGNHAAALAFAAALRGITAHIVIPSTALTIKKAAVVGYGGKITECEPTLAAREEAVERVIEATGAEPIHPYDDYRIIAAQASAAIELVEDAGELDFILAPVSGGGLVSGTALVVHYLDLPIRVIACEPRNADDAYRSFHEGRIVPIENPSTIADGLRAQLSEKTFDIIRNFVHDIVTVSEEEIVEAMRTIWERMKIIIEPSAAVPFAAAQAGKIPARGKRIGIILSGGNVDLGNLPFL